MRYFCYSSSNRSMETLTYLFNLRELSNVEIKCILERKECLNVKFLIKEINQKLLSKYRIIPYLQKKYLFLCLFLRLR